MPTFNGSNIFGINVSQMGPTPTRRAQREQLPGVKGFRSYNLQGQGPDTVAFVMRGRLVEQTPARLVNFISNSQNLLNLIASFTDNAGINWRNCQLIAYQPIGPYKHVLINNVDYYTIEITATLERASA